MPSLQPRQGRGEQAGAVAKVCLDTGRTLRMSACQTPNDAAPESPEDLARLGTARTFTVLQGGITCYQVYVSYGLSQALFEAQNEVRMACAFSRCPEPWRCPSSRRPCSPEYALSLAPLHSDGLISAAIGQWHRPPLLDLFFSLLRRTWTVEMETSRLAPSLMSPTQATKGAPLSTPQPRYSATLGTPPFSLRFCSYPFHTQPHGLILANGPSGQTTASAA